jgi:chain length determinant protein tyrosine kinase EpsG
MAEDLLVTYCFQYFLYNPNITHTTKQPQPTEMSHNPNYDAINKSNADPYDSCVDLPEGKNAAIGQLIKNNNNLTPAQLKEILEYQKKNNIKFGESAVKLGYASDSDVVFALSQQFNYPYTPENTGAINSELVSASQPFGIQAEAFRAIRSQLMMRVFSPQEPKRALAITSPGQGEGRTFLTANLGVVLAQLGGRTLIVDGNLRSPRLHALFSIPNTSGLTGVLSGRQEDNVIYQAADIPSLFVMPVGITPPNPLELLERPAFRLLISELLRKFDHVLIDTPAGSVGSDAFVIAARSGAALTLARRHHTGTEDLASFTAQLKETSAKLTGVIVNEF